MSTCIHHVEAGDEPLEVVPFGGDQWVIFEERDDAVHKIRATLPGEAHEHFPMVVMSAILDDPSAAEEAHEELQSRAGRRRLGHRELVLDLPAESASRVAHHGDRETAFTVDEADDPLLESWPFLLIVRTGRILTVHGKTVETGCDMNEYRRILGVSSI